ncbi:bifunctional molybdenum cofactor biosynthesis protein MoaC/MoaB [Nocardia stercoris]|uniref:cyclic pyranopterin monophosphate synthase n=1 Tax=Nocardia stercoris TaxID=2483361 RepID=A0A3M2LG69_9NOCA|nr:bifunctional molybdenum cofactor biosynthesis protein MoaC/MoaB [Nocardia stercoris]
MVDVSAKADTARIAVAAGELRTTTEVVRLVRSDDMPKADVLATARLAGIGGAKKTSELIPLCHQLALSKVDVRFGFTADTITIEATAKTKGPTGVEMEALTAVAVAGLTLHDMVKAIDPAATLNGVRLLTKDGGKRGHWERPAESPVPDAELGTESLGAEPHSHRAGHPAHDAERRGDSVAQDGHAGGAEQHGHDPAVAQAGAGRAAAVVVASTGAAAGTRVDKTGPVLVDWLAAQGFSVRGPLVYADAEIAAGLGDALGGAPALVITTGGTGASPSDATPEATLAVLDRELPGVAEEIRRRGAAGFPLAALSRGVAGLAGRTVVVNLPGSPGGVRDGIAVLQPLLSHLLAQVEGGGDHE